MRLLLGVIAVFLGLSKTLRKKKKEGDLQKGSPKEKQERATRGEESINRGIQT